MNVNIKLGKNFTTQYNKMVDKYGEEFEYLNGLHDTQMNYTDFIDNFTKDNISEVTIDANANTSRKDICSLNAEKGKSHDKLLTLNKIFYEMQKKYGISDARSFMELEWTGATYLHDCASASQKPYCYSYDLSRLATEGLFFLGERYNNEPPQHLDTFNDDFVEFVSWNCHRTSGECTVPVCFFSIDQWGRICG